MNTRKRLFLSLRSIVLAQLCLIPGAAFIHAQTAPAPAAAAADAADKDVLVLTPFEVVSTTKGYYASNTMSGTRFNAKLDDLASSISVMTKEQMADFGMLDINDVFLYVAGTEGTGTFTDYTLDRNGSLSDNVQNNPTQANRIRGIAPANVSLGNIETMGRVPIDPLAVDAIEISRGPNANVFGLGNPSGTVNQVAASANLTRDRLSTVFRADSYGGWRTSIDANQALIKGKLAVRVSGVYQKDAFQLKPSGVDTVRYNGMIKYQPFKNTTISAAINYYHASGNRPNALPPRDNISYWLSPTVGRPTWDPVTLVIHNSDGSFRFQVNTSGSNIPDYFSNAYLGNNRNQMFIDQNGLAYWSAPQGTTSTTSPTAATLQANRFLQPTALGGAVFSGTAPRSFKQFLFNTTPTINDKSIYDWSSINLSAPNRFVDKSTTTTVQIDQIFYNSTSQTLAAQATFMREDSERWARSLIGVANDNGQSGQLSVDINERLLDGTPNPYFLRPFLSVDKPRTVSTPATWDTSRAQLAYRLDLTGSKNFLKHLGWFQATTYAEYKYRVNRTYSWRDGVASPNVPWLTAGAYRGYNANPPGLPAVNNLTQGLYKYYVGDKTGTNVDYAPADFKYGTYNFVWGNGATGVMQNNALDLEPVASDKAGGTFNSKVTLRTMGAVLQSHLFGDRLVTTGGIRHDGVATQFGAAGNPTGAYLYNDGVNFNYDIINGWTGSDYLNGGQTTNIQFVLRPFIDTKMTSDLYKKGGAAGFFGMVLNGLSVNFNKSGSFLPLTPTQDLYRNSLPNPSGTDKSWGLGLNLFDGKLVIRATHYDNFQKNTQTGDINTMAGRVLRMDFMSPLTSGNPTPFINLYDNAKHWVTVGNPTWTTAQVDTEVIKETKFGSADAAYWGTPTPPIGAPSDLRSVGTEIEINYNPTKFWTVAASVTDTRSINMNVSKALATWIDERMPIWTTIVDPTITDLNAAAEQNPGKLWWNHHYSALPGSVVGNPNVATFSATAQTPQQNFQAFVGAPYGIIKAQEGKSNPQIRRYAFRASTSLQLSGITDNKWLKKMAVGGALRWEDKAAIGYYGVNYAALLAADQAVTELDANNPIYDSSHTFVDLFVKYKTKLWRDRITATYALNVKNLGQGTHLQPVGAFPDGTIHTYRIVDPQQFFVTASFDL